MATILYKNCFCTKRIINININFYPKTITLTYKPVMTQRLKLEMDDPVQLIPIDLVDLMSKKSIHYPIYEIKEDTMEGMTGKSIKFCRGEVCRICDNPENCS